MLMARLRGRFLRASIFALTGFCVVSTVASETPGTLDSTFASPTGKIVDFSFVANDSNLHPSEIVSQRDGKIVVLARCSRENVQAICLARFSNDGLIDTTFGGTAGDAPGTQRFTIGSFYNHPTSMFIDDDGRIVIAGVCFSNFEGVCVARLQPDGQLDASFVGATGDGGGRFLFQIAGSTPYVGVSAVKVGRGAVIASSCRRSLSDDPQLCIVKLREDGSFDSSFGSNGAVEISVPGAMSAVSPKLKSMPDGRLLILAACRLHAPNHAQRPCAARLLPSGALDQSWKGPDQESEGAFTFSEFSFDSPTFALRPDGRLVVSGFCRSIRGDGHEVCFVGLDESGRFDLAFRGPTGEAGGNFRLEFSLVQLVSTPLALMVQNDGRLLLVGTCFPWTHEAGDDVANTCLLRLNPDGSLDRGFVNPASAINNFLHVSLVNAPEGGFPPLSSGDGAMAGVMSQDGGKMTTLGGCRVGRTSAICLARFHLGNTRPRVCTPDLDGDGKHTTTVDGLILARAMLGFKGDSALEGVAFERYAQRRTWSAIKGYLVEQCEMTID